jgi:transcriptional regulator with XRE-family HTH domain
LNLGDVIYKWRAMSKLGLRGAAEELGLSASSISRIENGEMIPDGENLMKIFNWLMRPTKDGK